ncbi:MAG: hypothetical protein KAV00_07700 [Phycisphaerae bacterium]|nr:hypothetical protein [Phycisphaerae bacterium]
MTRHTKENFARYLGHGQIIRRRDLSVCVANTAADRTHQASRQTPDPEAIAESGSTRLTEIKRRFAICKACEHSRDDGFACDLYHDCCFGKFRSTLKNRCPDGHW